MIWYLCHTHKKTSNKSIKNRLKQLNKEYLHLNSSHCHANAKANHAMFTTLSRTNASENDYMPYLNQWILYQDLAYYKEPPFHEQTLVRMTICHT